jgi:hypothetical protein
MPVKWEDLAAGGAGAVDEFLFGLPEFIAKKIDRKKVEDYIKTHEKAYRTGETIGTVGSIFLPVPGVGLAKSALGIGKAAKVAGTAAKGLKGLGKLAAKGALSGAAEAGVRGITAEKTPEQILNDLRMGGLLGGAGGAVGGLLSKGISKIGSRAKDVAEEAVERSEKSILGLTALKGRDTNRLLKEMSGPGAKGLGKFKKAEMTREKLAKLIRDEGLYKAGADDRYFAQVSKDWDDIGKAFEGAYPDARGSQILGEAIKRGTDDIQDVMKMPGGKDAVDRLAKYLADTKDLQGIHPIKSYLANVVKDTFNPSKAMDANAAEAERALANILRRNMDDMSLEAAEQAGLKIDFKKRKDNYIFDRTLADSFARDQVAPMRVNTGSPTAEKLGMGLAGATLGGATGLGGEDLPIEERLAKAGRQALMGGVAGLAGSAMKGAASKLATRAIAGSKDLADLAAKAAPGIEDIAGKIAGKVTPEAAAITGGIAASSLSRRAAEAAEPQTPTEAEAAEAGASAGSGDQPAYVGKIMDRIKAYAASKGVDEGSPEFSQFAAMVEQATEGFDPEKVGGILYPDQAERAVYQRALSTARRMSEVLPAATSEAPGMFSGATEEQEMMRTAAIDQLAALVGDVAKERGSEKAAKTALTKILRGKEDPARKEELVRILLAQYGVDLDQLTEMGVI